MAKLVSFFEPAESLVSVRSDDGRSFDSRPEFVAERLAQVIDLPADFPNGWGAQRTISAQGYDTTTQHGVVRTDITNPATGSALFDVDTGSLRKSSGSIPFVMARFV